jgi:hypothetical protein
MTSVSVAPVVPICRPSAGLSIERSRIHCHWVEVEPSRQKLGARTLACANPKYHRGMAGETRSCCLFEREPGADDDL